MNRADMPTPAPGNSSEDSGTKGDSRNRDLVHMTLGQYLPLCVTFCPAYRKNARPVPFLSSAAFVLVPNIRPVTALRRLAQLMHHLSARASARVPKDGNSVRTRDNHNPPRGFTHEEDPERFHPDRADDRG